MGHFRNIPAGFIFFFLIVSALECRDTVLEVGTVSGLTRVEFNVYTCSEPHPPMMLQWRPRIKDTLGLAMLSFVGRLRVLFSEVQNVLVLREWYFEGVLCRAVVPFLEGPLSEARSTVARRVSDYRLKESQEEREEQLQTRRVNNRARTR